MVNEDDHGTEVTTSSAPAPAPLPLGLRVGKDVSVGEYDSATGLTFVTRQRGRLHFHMGVNAVRLARVDGSLASEVAPGGSTTPRETAEHADAYHTAAEAETETEAAQPQFAADALVPPLRTGSFTGLALFAEEAFYLVQRGALVVWELSHPPPTAEYAATISTSDRPLDAAQFVALLLRDGRASLPCLHAYVALKENQFYPRRHISRAGDAVGVAQQPQHFTGDDSGACPIAFDAWKATTETMYVPNDGCKATAELPGGQTRDAEARRESRSEDARSAKRRAKKDAGVKKRKVKRLRLAFRVVVCRYADAAPSSACLLRTAALTPENSNAAGEESALEPAPVKFAVVDQDRSVLFFEIGAPGEELQTTNR